MEKKCNEVNAAIALALHEYAGNTKHDNESGVITIRKNGSEWDSHIMSMTQFPTNK